MRKKEIGLLNGSYMSGTISWTPHELHCDSQLWAGNITPKVTWSWFEPKEAWPHGPHPKLQHSTLIVRSWNCWLTKNRNSKASSSNIMRLVTGRKTAGHYRSRREIWSVQILERSQETTQTTWLSCRSVGDNFTHFCFINITLKHAISCQRLPQRIKRGSSQMCNAV